MQLNELTAISPIDGRYRSKTQHLAYLLSEYGLIKYRVLIEIRYFEALCAIPLPQLAHFPTEAIQKLHLIEENFSIEDARTIKEIEKITNHDVKAVEYFLKERFDQLQLAQYKEFIHFGLTSQDINNTAIPLILKHTIHQHYLPAIHQLTQHIEQYANLWQHVPMLARTHGQPASPTRLGKELHVFVERLQNQTHQLQNIPFSAKFGGATGNFNAHHVTYPNISWVAFANEFVNQTLALSRSQYTTQIEHYDNLAALFHNLARINTILTDLCRDIWHYISLDYFKQKTKPNEVGSSAMPHKVNPIDFENAEGNLGIANALLEHLAAKLPISRLQRDLTDSTVLRNIGVPFAHIAIAIQSIQKGIEKLLLNPDKLHDDLENNWAVVAEAIQNILRREAYPQPYEALKQLTRGKTSIQQADIHQFIDTLQIPPALKNELKNITPHNYLGI